VFFASPNGLLQRSDDGERRLPGGVHMPSASGLYYSFFSMWVSFSDGDFAKLPLPEECLSPWGSAHEWVRNGEAIPP
jgi:hypothetical protein